MKAMVLEARKTHLKLRDAPPPTPANGEVLVRVKACGVCRTDLHVYDGELPGGKLPVIPGHQVVGEVVTVGPGVRMLRQGARVGVPWMAKTCGMCRFCCSGKENLCPQPEFTGHTRDGGYAEFLVANEQFCLPLPPGFGDIQVAPLLCAGVIGHRAIGMTGGADCIALYGFGSSAHIVAQVLLHQRRKVFAYTRPGDTETQQFARSLGVQWAGDVGATPPEKPKAAIVFAAAGELVPEALRAVDRAGVVVCAGIHMSDIPSFPYSVLWEERVLRSVANLTRRDGDEFLRLAAEMRLQTQVTAYPLERANDALEDLRHGRFRGSAVLTVA